MKLAPRVAVAATRLWVERVVIGLSLCPWAAPVRESIRYAHTPAANAADTFGSLLREVELLRSEAEIATTILVAPGFERDDFAAFNAFVQDAEEYFRTEGLDDDFQLVGFHPSHVFAGEEPSDAGNFANRSPFPMLHLLRQESVTVAVDGHESLEVPHVNAALLRRTGSEALQAELRRACADAQREAG